MFENVRTCRERPHDYFEDNMQRFGLGKHHEEVTRMRKKPEPRWAIWDTLISRSENKPQAQKAKPNIYTNTYAYRNRHAHNWAVFQMPRSRFLPKAWDVSLRRKSAKPPVRNRWRKLSQSTRFHLSVPIRAKERRVAAPSSQDGPERRFNEYSTIEFKLRGRPFKRKIVSSRAGLLKRVRFACCIAKASEVGWEMGMEGGWTAQLAWEHSQALSDSTEAFQKLKDMLERTAKWIWNT